MNLISPGHYLCHVPGCGDLIKSKISTTIRVSPEFPSGFVVLGTKGGSATEQIMLDEYIPKVLVERPGGFFGWSIHRYHG